MSGIMLFDSQRTVPLLRLQHFRSHRPCQCKCPAAAASPPSPSLFFVAYISLLAFTDALAVAPKHEPQPQPQPQPQQLLSPSPSPSLFSLLSPSLDAAAAAAERTNAADFLSRKSAAESDSWFSTVKLKTATGLNLNSTLLAREKAHATPACGITQQVGGQDDKSVRCPAKCPVFAEHKDDGVHCDFRCVAATVKECTELNPLEPIPDIELGTCRACMVSGCAQCATDGTDTCALCSSGYDVTPTGQCQSKFFYVWVVVFLFFGVVLAVVLAWVISLALAPAVNTEVMQHGLDHRSRSKLLRPTEVRVGAEAVRLQRKPWQLSTNLCKTEVAGPGLQLQFNYQRAIIVWAFVVGIAWYVLTVFLDPELGRLGLHSGGTARQNCIVVAFGWNAQQRLMPTKVIFVACVYVISFILAIVFGVSQLRLFQSSDAQQTTHKDFCARCTGIPALTGDVKVEEELKSQIASTLQKEVVNVSVCWDYEDVEAELLQVLEQDLSEREKKRRGRRRRASRSNPVSPTRGAASPTAGGQSPAKTEDGEGKEARRVCWAFRKVEAALFSDETADLVNHAGESDGVNEKDVSAILKSLVCTGQAFVVFQTEAERDLAVQLSFQLGGVPFHGAQIKLEAADTEPASVLWLNCVEKTWLWKLKRIAGGFVSYSLAMSFWVFGFYAPYAYIILSSNYNYGQEASMVSSTAFTFVVVAGNALMYFTCSEIADKIGFQSADNREVLYMLLYTIACMLNVLLDMVVTYFMAYSMLVGAGFSTWNGRPLKEVHTFTARFETYAMQRSLGENLWVYSFPSTFLVPFLIEPVATIIGPFLIMKWLVRSHTGIKRWTGERLLTPLPMDLSRYADVLLNVMLAVLMFYFPPGWTHWIFIALACSHIVIYVIDHYRVLRCIPSCYYSSNDTDWWAQWMLSLPLGLVLASLVFKMNSMGIFRFTGYALIAVCTVAFCLHVLLHTWVLLRVVPRFGKQASSVLNAVQYRTCAQSHPVSWFASNPVFCLRSKYVYQHDPPCDFCITGKEHLLRLNEKQGFYFHDREADAEVYVEPESWTDFRGLFAELITEVQQLFMADNNNLIGGDGTDCEGSWEQHGSDSESLDNSPMASNRSREGGGAEDRLPSLQFGSLGAIPETTKKNDGQWQGQTQG